MNARRMNTTANDLTGIVPVPDQRGSWWFPALRVAAGLMIVGSMFVPWSGNGDLSTISMTRFAQLSASGAGGDKSLVVWGALITVALAMAAVNIGSTRGGMAYAGALAGVGTVLAATVALTTVLTVGNGSGRGLGAIMALAGAVAMAGALTLDRLRTASPRPRSRSTQIVPLAGSAGVLVAFAALIATMPDLGATSPDAARAGLVDAVRVDDNYGAATYLLPDDLDRLGRIAEIIDLVAEPLKLDGLLDEAGERSRAGGLAATILGFAEGILPTGQADGRHYVQLPG